MVDIYRFGVLLTFVFQVNWASVYTVYQYFALFSACKQQQQARPGPVADNRDGSEEVQRGPKRAALAERKVNKEYPQEFSVAKYVFLF